MFALVAWVPGGKVALVAAGIALGTWFLISAGLIFASMLGHLQPSTGDWISTLAAATPTPIR